jgi:hypothetical protein
MPRSFRFRVREGHQIHSFSEDGTETHGAGYEFVLSEEDAALVLRERRTRNSLELVEVLAEDEAATPRVEPAAGD